MNETRKLSARLVASLLSGSGFYIRSWWFYRDLWLTASVKLGVQFLDCGCKRERVEMKSPRGPSVKQAGKVCVWRCRAVCEICWHPGRAESAVSRVLCKFVKPFILALQIYKYMCANGQCDEFAYIIYRCYITTLTWFCGRSRGRRLHERGRVGWESSYCYSMNGPYGIAGEPGGMDADFEWGNVNYADGVI